MKVICARGEEEIFLRRGLDRGAGDLPGGSFRLIPGEIISFVSQM